MLAERGGLLVGALPGRGSRGREWRGGRGWSGAEVQQSAGRLRDAALQASRARPPLERPTTELHRRRGPQQQLLATTLVSWSTEHFLAVIDQQVHRDAD